ncbi:MAG: CHAT domain-containing protein [Cyanobacteria bacterium J06638_20]
MTQQELLRGLHELLIVPVEDLLPDDPNQQVVFIPQRELFSIPFAALQDTNGQYLIEGHTLSIAPAAQILQLTQRQRLSKPKRQAWTQNPLIIGNPQMPAVRFTPDRPPQPLNPLPGAEQEATDIAMLLATSALIGEQATEATVKQRLPSAQLIHLATHGLLEYGRPEDSGVSDVPGAIALTPDAQEDGLLTAAEILAVRLQADLVVLSACDTGRGDITDDGINGLSRAFIMAGVSSVVVSLWAVPDAPTAELMTEFYRQLQQGQNKAQALRQAMLTIMKTYPEPRNWSAFTLVGEVE